MGLGKTEIALLAVEQLAYMTGSDGLFMGLPTQATTNAMFNRVNKWLKFLADFQDENFEIKLMHSKAQFNKTYRSLPDASNVYGEADAMGMLWLMVGFLAKSLFYRSLRLAQLIISC